MAPPSSRMVLESQEYSGPKEILMETAVEPQPSKKSKKRKRSSSIIPQAIVEKEYEVESIISHEMYNGKVLRYFVKWKGWSDDDNTWEPFSNLYGCLDLLVEYFESKLPPNNNNNLMPINSRYLSLLTELSKTEEDDLVSLARLYFTPKGHSVPHVNENLLDHYLKVLSRLPPIARDVNFIGKIKRMLVFRQLIELRKRQLQSLNHWENEINNIYGSECPPITIENSVDLVGAPSDFIYIDKYIPGPDVVIDNNPIMGCSCVGKQCLHMKCKQVHNCFKNYSNGLVNVPKQTGIYECNSLCQCDSDCGNRVVQKGRQFPLTIFRTFNNCGWGVKTTVDIPKGSYVCQYVGEVITFEEAERRGKLYVKEGSTYLFDLDFDDRENFPYTVDAKVYGNISHFINHSCNPNLIVYAVWIECIDVNIPHLCLFAAKNIKAGEELNFDYLCQPISSNTQRDPNSLKVLCKCGHQKCRKYLY